MPPIKPPRYARAEASAVLPRLRGRAAIPAAPRIGRAVGAVLKPHAGRHGASLSEIIERWPDIAGERLAKLARPEKLSRSRGGATLTLRAAGPTAVLLQAEAPRLIERANLYCGPGTVDRLAFKHGPLKESARSAKAPTPMRRGLTPSEEESLSDSLRPVRSESLRKSLSKLGRAVKSRTV